MCITKYMVIFHTGTIFRLTLIRAAAQYLFLRRSMYIQLSTPVILWYTITQ
jgi:hypothetical protein